MKPAIFNLGVASSLVNHVAQAIGANVLPLDQRTFPDGEAYVRLMDQVRDRDVLLFAPPAGNAESVLPLLFAADAARDQGARQVGLVAPYLGYMRQDRAFQEGEAVTSRTFARLLSSTFDWLLTVDPHLHRYASLDEIYSIPTAVVSAAAPIAAWIAVNVEHPLIIGPDAESNQWVDRIADIINAPRAVFTKTRRGDRDVELNDHGADIGDFTPVIVDDVISSARTLAEAVRLVRARAAAAPTCIGVHAIFAGDALQVLQAARPATICTSNTIAHETNRVSVGPAIADALLESGWIALTLADGRATLPSLGYRPL